MYKYLSEGLLFCLRVFYLESVYVGESTFLFAHKIMENEGSCIEVFSASNFAFRLVLPICYITAGLQNAAVKKNN